MRRLVLRVLLTVWASVVAAITLSSGDPAAPPVTEQLFCLACGTRGLADMLLNWVLFVPLGLGLGWLRNARTAVRVSFLATASIEAIQLFLPGRHPALQDIVANSLGGASGAWLAGRATQATVSRVLSIAAIAAWLAPAALLLPSRSEAPYFGQWTPNRGELEVYRGQVLSATVGGVPVPSHLVDRSRELGEALRRREPWSVRLVLGDPPRSGAPIFSIYDSRGRGVLHLAVIGDDLVVQHWGLASGLRFDSPGIRRAGALSGLSAGDTVTIRGDPLRSSYCLEVDAATQCRLAPGAGDGWAFLLNPMGAPADARAVATVMWSLAVGAALGLSVGAVGPAAAAGLGLGTAGVLAGVLTAALRPSPAHAALLLIGCLLGAALRAPMSRLVDFLRGDDAQSSAMPQRRSTSTP